MESDEIKEMNELNQEIFAILQDTHKESQQSDEEKLMVKVDNQFEKIIEIENHQLTQEDLQQECKLISTTLRDLIKLMSSININKSATIDRLNYAIDYLTILKDLYETVLELFQNNELRFKELISKYQNNEELHIKATKISDFNFYGLEHMTHVFTQQTLKSIIQIGHQYFSTHNSYRLTNQLIIYNSHLNILVRIFASAIDLDKGDLISLQRNHPYWKQIRQISTYTQLSSNPEQVTQSYYNFMKAIRIGHAIFLKKSKISTPIIRDIIFIVSSLWYFMLDQRAKKRALEHMCDMQIDSALNVMNMVEKSHVKILMELGITSIKHNFKIYIDPVVLPLTLQYMNSEFEKGRLNKITNEQIEYVNQSIHFDISQHESIFKKDKTKLRIRILSSQDIIKHNSFHQLFFRQDQVLDTIIIHFHGGGFIAMSSSTHQNYTREWSNQLGIPLFSVDYSLAPKFKYPNAVNDCWQAYHWILNHLQYHFNIKPKKILLAGDSAGGNLCCAITGLAIKYGIQVPNGILLSYPVLDLKMKYSPSHINGLEDFLLPHTLMDICIDSYTDHPNSREFDPFRSPNHMSDEILSKFPPVRILIGSNDPLIDHSHRLVHSLLRNNRDVKITVYEGMSHGFLSFYMLGGMREAGKCIEDSIVYLRELLAYKTC